MADQIVGNLANRLEVEQWYAQHPEIDEQQIVAPLFGLGLPRTGSTALSFLLAQDPARRSLRVWEAGTPCPPPETATEHTDPRIAAAQAGIDFTNEMFPGFADMLPTAADGPQECLVADGARLPVADVRRHGVDPELQRTGCCTATCGPPTGTTGACSSCCSGGARPTAGGSRRPAHMLVDRRPRRRVSGRAVRDDPSRRRRRCCRRSACCTAPSPACSPTASTNALSARTTSSCGARRSSGCSQFRDAGNEHRFVDLAFDDVQRDPIG